MICDGNARWAQSRGVPVTAGHEAAADTVIARAKDAAHLGISELTVYSFSTENWSRPPAEVHGLIQLLAKRIGRDTPDLHHQGIRLRFIGRRNGVSPALVAAMTRAEALTKRNSGMRLFVALNYGGRAEILDAARAFRGTTEHEFCEFLYAPDMHDPDLIIRTGGERRLSNYLLWQAAYAELVFREELWPDFTRQALEESIGEFHARRRQFGGR
jgi:undecaprenyl diphosphate synthase